MLIKSSSGLYFHSSADLLCAAFGSCIGKNLVRYCAQNKINVEAFEQVAVDFIDEKFIIYVNHPKSLTAENKSEIESLILNCSVSQMLNADKNVEFRNNNIDPDLTRKSNNCCGG
jgi:uncharacterized OsmC-like protein